MGGAACTGAKRGRYEVCENAVFCRMNRLCANGNADTFRANGARSVPSIERKDSHMAKRKTRTTKRKSTTETKPRTKSQIFSEIATSTELTKREVASVFDAMNGLMKKDLGRRGPGQFTVPGLMKVVKVHKPKRAARKNVPNPVRPGEMMDIAAKPAKNVVKVRPLKALKEMV